jgi:hypothetical protein
LSIYYNYENSDETFYSDPVWQMKNNHGAHWQYGRVQINGDNGDIKNIIIQANATYVSNGILINS